MENACLKIAQIFYSIQGESTFAGRPCTFIRLAGCNLRCNWCDTPEALGGGEIRKITTILRDVKKHGCPLVEITGGEPLFQSSTPLLAEKLLETGFVVLLETNGTYPLDKIPDGVIKIVDIKTPSSGEAGSFYLPNLSFLKYPDQIKFIIATENDFTWSKQFIETHRVNENIEIMFSPVLDAFQPRRLAELILRNRMNVRIQIQLHKIIGLK